MIAFGFAPFGSPYAFASDGYIPQTKSDIITNGESVEMNEKTPCR